LVLHIFAFVLTFQLCFASHHGAIAVELHLHFE
jgi:hypothetical protein